MKIAFIHKFCFLNNKLIRLSIGTLFTIPILFSFTLATDIQVVNDKEDCSFSGFMYEKLGLGKYHDFWRTEVSTDWSRSDNPNAVGYYYQLPRGLIEEIKTDSANIQFIKPLIKRYLNSQYYSDILVDSLKSYNLYEFKRREFFGKYLVDSTPVRISGWHGKFVHIIITVDYDSKSSFLKQAQKYFNLGELEEKYVTLSIDSDPRSDGKYEFYCSYGNESKDYKLVGYTILGYDKSLNKFHIAKTVIDLTIYNID